MNGLQKFYIGLWTAYGLIIVGLAVTGNLTMLALTVLGFVCFGLIFMGMMCVLPTTVHNQPTPKAKSAMANAAPSFIRRFINAWSRPVGVELGRPKLH